MTFSVEDLDDHNRFRLFIAIPYKNLVQFVFKYLSKRSALMVFFWTVCLIFLFMAIKVRINIAGYFLIRNVLLHSTLGFIVFPLLCIPVHEVLHIIPFYFSGAKNIRVGMDLKQYIFYVTAHRHVTTPIQFWIVAITPFLIISLAATLLVFLIPGLWKWSLSLFLFAHTTMCAGDFAMLNFYFLNRDKKIYTWDDVDKKEAYFYEEIS